MSWRAGHGNGAGVPRIEALPADELPQPDPEPPPSVALAFRANGTIADATTAKELGRRGGLKRAARTRMLVSLGLTTLEEGHAFHPYEAAAEAFVAKHVATLAAMFDGTTGEGPASIVSTAGIQLAASRFMYDQGKQTGDAKLLGEAAKLGDASRQNILAAYELQAREAAARSKSAGASDLRTRVLGDA